jgi:hypothetical protein
MFLGTNLYPMVGPVILYPGLWILFYIISSMFRLEATAKVLTTHAGTPQETLAEPNNFKLLMNDLTFDQENIKYVEDTTVLSVSTNPQDPS